jgi:hypothetical protein
MEFIRKLLGARGDSSSVDYYREGTELLRVGRYHEALTSFRLALRERPGDVATSCRGADDSAKPSRAPR